CRTVGMGADPFAFGAYEEASFDDDPLARRDAADHLAYLAHLRAELHRALGEPSGRARLFDVDDGSRADGLDGPDRHDRGDTGLAHVDEDVGIHAESKRS